MKTMTLTELFDKPDAIELVDAELRALAAENPDFVYNPDYLARKDKALATGCYYIRGADGGPTCDGCIFGQALQRLGVSLKELGEQDLTDDGISELAANLGVYNTDNWREVQNAQDHGESWGEAIKKL